MFLELPFDFAFLAGLGAFWLGHVFSLLAFLCDERRLLLSAAILPVLAGTSLLACVLGSVPDTMQAPVCIYAGTLVGVVYRASARLRCAEDHLTELAVFSSQRQAMSHLGTAYTRFGGNDGWAGRRNIYTKASGWCGAGGAWLFMASDSLLALNTFADMQVDYNP